jgi:hypothetical protein
MSTALIIFLVVTLVLIFSQFGGKLSATSAWHWWLVGLFLVVAAYVPEFYRPIADLFGIKFISNFVLAALVMFLFMQVLSSQAVNIELIRKQRRLISAYAVRQYFTKNKDSTCIRTMVILPTFNEEATVDEVARDLEILRKEDSSVNYCFVNDGSFDGTSERLIKIGESHFVEHLVNINVAGVLGTGFELAHLLGVDFVVQCDADGQHPVSEIKRLVSEMEKRQLDCLIGSRYLGVGFFSRLQEESTSILRVLGGQCLCWALRLLFGAKISDPTSGFRVYSRAAIELLRRNIPDEYPEPESIAIIARSGLRISETSVKMNRRIAGVSSLSGGLKSVAYMSKVISALLGLRMRSWVR